MWSAVNLLTHTFTGQAQSSKRLTQYCAYSFARDWQLPFLNQQKGEYDYRKYFMINLHERMLPTWRVTKGTFLPSYIEIGPVV